MTKAQGAVPSASQKPIADPAEAEGDRHRVFAPDMVGDPAEQRPGGAVCDVVDEQRHGQGRAAEQQHGVGDVEIMGDQRDLCRRHQPARRNQDEHDVQHPEHRRRQHRLWRIAVGGLDHLGRRGRRHLTRQRPAHQPRQHKDDRALHQPEPEKRRRIAMSGDDCADRDNGQRGARAKARCGQPDGEPAAVGEPLYRIANAGCIDGAGADAGQHRPQIEHRQGAGARIDDPSDPDHDPAKGHHQPRPVFRADAVDDPALDRRQPGFERDKDAEGDLDVGDSPAMRHVHRMNEQGPAILQVGDHHHADDADDQLEPTVRCRYGGRPARR